MYGVKITSNSLKNIHKLKLNEATHLIFIHQYSVFSKIADPAFSKRVMMTGASPSLWKQPQCSQFLSMFTNDVYGKQGGMYRLQKDETISIFAPMAASSEDSPRM